MANESNYKSASLFVLDVTAGNYGVYSILFAPKALKRFYRAKSLAHRIQYDYTYIKLVPRAVD